jgi:hypothetical protein
MGRNTEAYASNLICSIKFVAQDGILFQKLLRAVICGFSVPSWSLTLREEYRLRVSENRMLGKIYLDRRGMK